MREKRTFDNEIIFTISIRNGLVDITTKNKQFKDMNLYGLSQTFCISTISARTEVFAKFGYICLFKFE